jgi:tRNA modification GTPase
MPDIHLDDTIAAIATPPGEGGIAVIRLSGPQSIAIASEIFHPKKGTLPDAASHTVHYGTAQDADSRVLDQVLATVFRSPNSYTGQDIVELSAHGGIVVTRKILDSLIQKGARHAEPGEFTKRAFLNGKIDLTQAEAVLDLIRAKSDKSLEAAVRQLGGSLAKQFHALKDELMKMYAHMEAFLDFPDEHLEVYEDQAFLSKFDKVLSEMQRLIASFGRGNLLREGVTVVLAGKPNVGKSSLFNALLARDRALVSEFPGTTRDLLEEAVEIQGIYVRLIDTAGLNGSPSHPVEAMGMERTRQSVREAQLLLFMVDGSVPLDGEDRNAFEEIRKQVQKPVLVVANSGNSNIITISSSKKPIKVLSKDRSAHFPPK